MSEIVPPPWELHGEGYILLYRFTADFAPEVARRIGVVMLVRYADSGVGPYDELLFIPGQVRVDGRLYWRITWIYVSTEVSVVNGRQHWGIPKRLAAFDWQDQADGSTRVRVTTGETCIAAFDLRPRGPSLPVTTGLLPDRLHTLHQPMGPAAYRVTPRARGRIQMAEVQALDGAHFADVSSQRRLAALHVPHFDMVFPQSVTDGA